MLCESEIEPFKNWTSDPGMDVSKENFLVDQGYKELEGIGARYAERFPGLFPKNFSNETYYVSLIDSQQFLNRLLALL